MAQAKKGLLRFSFYTKERAVLYIDNETPWGTKNKAKCFTWPGLVKELPLAILATNPRRLSQLCSSQEQEEKYHWR